MNTHTEDATVEPQKRVEVANLVLTTFAPGTTVGLRPDGRVQVSWEGRSGPVTKVWMTRGQDFYPVWHRKWEHGGTACTALANLVRWIKGMPVVPIGTWDWWADPDGNCKLLRQCDPAPALQAMRDAGYPEQAACVLCGRSPLRGFDWWNLDGVSGPCCRYSDRYGCRQQRGAE